MKHKTFELLETKADDENGVGWFTALASVFGNVDHVGDRVMPGAFKKTLGKWRESGSPIPVFLSHQWDNPFSLIGEVDPRAVVENDKGLLVQGKLDMENDTAKQVHKLMKRGLLKGFSFGYNVPDGGEKLNTEDGANELYEVDLVELGPTLKGANPEAQLQEVKATLPPVTTNDLKWATTTTNSADTTVTLTKTPQTATKASRNVGPGARAHLRSLIEYYMKKPHPFTACVRDNTKRFGEEGAKRVCATLKDIGEGTTRWREGHHSAALEKIKNVEPVSLKDFKERDFEQELYDAADGNFEGLMEMFHEYSSKSSPPGSAEADEPETVKPAAKADPLRDEIDRLLLRSGQTS